MIGRLTKYADILCAPGQLPSGVLGRDSSSCAQEKDGAISVLLEIIQ